MSQRSDSPVEVVRSFLAAMAVKDYGTAIPLVSADCDYENLPIVKVRGPGGVRAVLEPFFAPTKENEFVILREACAGPVVFMERLDRHLLSSGWVELPVAGVFEVHGGLITVWHDYCDAAALLKAWPTA